MSRERWAVALALACAIGAGGCSGPPDAPRLADAATAEAALIAAAAPGTRGVDSPYGRIEHMELLQERKLLRERVTGWLRGAPRQDGHTPSGRYAITVRLESGELRTVVMAQSGRFRVGDRVRVNGDLLVGT